MKEHVYAVRLTEAERQTVRSSLGLNGSDYAQAIMRRIESARPEHPDRQAALEAIAEAVSLLSANDEDCFQRLDAAYEYFRSLEGR